MTGSVEKKTSRGIIGEEVSSSGFDGLLNLERIFQRCNYGIIHNVTGSVLRSRITFMEWAIFHCSDLSLLTASQVLRSCSYYY